MSKETLVLLGLGAATILLVVGGAILFSNTSPSAKTVNIFLEYAKELNLDTDKFKNPIEDNKFEDKIQQDENDGVALGVNSTPTFFINGEKVENLSSFKELKTRLDETIQNLSLSSDSSKPKADLKLLIRPNSNKISTPSAKVTLVEFSDLQCPACAQAHPVVKQILEENKGNINFVYRHFPLSQHKNARIAAEAAEAAGEQGKFFEMVSKLFENQNKWSE